MKRLALWVVVACCMKASTLFGQGLDSELSGTEPGGVIATGLSDLEGLEHVSYTKSLIPGTQLLLSDSPEYLSERGICLRETVEPGAFRLYLYNCPDTPDGAQKTISAVLENRGERSLTLTIRRRSFPKPSKDYFVVAKEGLNDLFSDHAVRPASLVPPGGRVVIDPEMDATLVSPKELVHGIFEVEIDQPAQVTVFLKNPGENSLTVIDELPILSAVGGAGRGLFPQPCYEVEVSVDTASGRQVLLLADGTSDPWIEGRDSASGGRLVQDDGNYGVMYRIHLSVHSGDGRRLALVICRPPTSGPWCTAAAAAVEVDGQAVLLPQTQLTFSALPQGVLIWKVGVPAGQEKSVDLVFSPPGASCLPMPILLLPYSEPAE